MKIFDKIYEFSISPQLSHRILFWGTLTILNAITGYILSMDGDFDIVGKILGIGTWIAIYVWFVAPRYSSYGHSLFGTSVFWAYIIKTVFILCYPISMLLDLWVGMLNVSVMSMIVSIFPILEDGGDKIFPYLLTIMHGFVLSLLTLMLAYCIYLMHTMSAKVTSRP